MRSAFGLSAPAELLQRVREGDRTERWPRARVCASLSPPALILIFFEGFVASLHQSVLVAAARRAQTSLCIAPCPHGRVRNRCKELVQGVRAGAVTVLQ